MHAPVVERQAGTERVVGVQRLHRPDQLVDVHRAASQCLAVPDGRSSAPVAVDYRWCARRRQCHSVTDRGALGGAPRGRAGSVRAYLPMQKRLKISPSRSSAREGAGDLAERVVRQAQLLGEQVERRRRRRSACASAASRCSRGALQRIDVAGAGDEHALGRGLPAGAARAARGAARRGPAPVRADSASAVGRAIAPAPQRRPC